MRLKVEFMTEFMSDVSDSQHAPGLIKTTGALGCNSVANVHILMAEAR